MEHTEFSHASGAANGYRGTIGKTLQESQPWWPAQRAALPGTPNIVVVLLDDLGFSDFGCFGSEIRTPHIDALAQGGLRFANYTTVPMCTPARAALMTGKNPHAVGCGWLTHNNPGYPGYQAGEMASDAPTMAELLRERGFSTYAVGKWHNTADHNVSPAGARDSWPLQRGFDRFYGFLAAETNYFAPGQLVEGNSFLDTDDYPEDYYCSDDWTDKAIGWLKAHQGASPDKPFFLYLAHNAPHVPLQAKPQDIERYAGEYDQGWDEIRRQRYERQRAQGVIPADWQLSDRGSNIPAWDQLTPEQRSLYAHYMAVYAAMVDNIDQNIGRLADHLRDAGVLDNTLFILTSDNGASSIGGPQGAANIFEKRVSGVEPASLAADMMRDGKLGGVDSYAAYPVGWGNASNTPFRFYKRTPMNGGIRVPYIVHWPQGIRDGGAIRREWIHVTDTLPTLMEIAGIDYPDRFRGNRTRGLNGISFRAMLADPAQATRRTRQHYELEGNRGYIRDHWKIVSLQPPGTRIDLDNWMLFDLLRDPTECEDVAAANRGVLAELVAEFEADAQANHIYPLDNRDNRRVLAVPPFLEKSYSLARTFHAGMSTVPTAVISPLIADRDYTLECRFSSEPGSEGVLLAFGNAFGGLSVFVADGQLHVVYNVGERSMAPPPVPLAQGDHHFVLEHRALGARRASATVLLDGQVAMAAMDMSPTILRLTGEGLDVGCDRRLKVSERYKARGAFRYNGAIRFVRLTPGKQAADSLANRPERLAQID
ncbi:arylsulfatase [Cupriavidus basilensis OR16]|uniref:Arylsulfatase n=1 Tax=Cupriavidus basilensis OR16 TaxID=1127483 RepID=H1S5T6_9BURK|nr:arylsulfatase [Cupriavidus basilensis]EHP42168.1 arylsulfatase [Cupriavidus basilensis OR16]